VDPGNEEDGAMSNDEPKATEAKERSGPEEGGITDDEDREWPQLQPFELDVMLATTTRREPPRTDR
jgi:hypothetical protein